MTDTNDTNNNNDDNNDASNSQEDKPKNRGGRHKEVREPMEPKEKKKTGPKPKPKIPIEKKPIGQPVGRRPEGYRIPTGNPEGRPRKHPEGVKPKPLDPDYFKKYYVNTLKPQRIEEREREQRNARLKDNDLPSTF